MPGPDSEGRSQVKVSSTQHLSHFFSYLFPFRKHSSSKGSMPLSEDAIMPKPWKTQPGLSFLGKPSSSKDSEDSSKEPSLSTQVVPMIKYSGRSSRLCASSVSQSTGDSLLAAVSP